MITIGVTQIKNSTSFEKNFNSIAASLDVFSETDVDLVLFPECSLSGFSANIKECTSEAIQSYIKKIEAWAKENNKAVILPTALMRDSLIFNTGFIFDEEGKQQFYKLGLTNSEKKFFSIPNEQTQKVFKVKDVNIAILICFEAQMNPWEFFNDGEVDVVLWPGYWGWPPGLM